MLNDVLCCIVCGCEHTGTTYTEALILQHPSLINSTVPGKGLEGGLFLASSPDKFTVEHVPLGNWRMFYRMWDIPVDSILNCSTHEAAWRFVRAESPLISDRILRIVDKCPAYVRYFPDVAERSEDLPIIITKKALNNFQYSNFVRGVDVGVATEGYRNFYGPVLEKAMEKYGDRILLIQFEDFARIPMELAERIYTHVGLDFKPSYVVGQLEKYQPDRHPY